MLAVELTHDLGRKEIVEPLETLLDVYNPAHLTPLGNNTKDQIWNHAEEEYRDLVQ
jgi:hypothetical protein